MCIYRYIYIYVHTIIIMIIKVIWVYMICYDTYGSFRDPYWVSPTFSCVSDSKTCHKLGEEEPKKLDLDEALRQHAAGYGGGAGAGNIRRLRDFSELFHAQVDQHRLTLEGTHEAILLTCFLSFMKFHEATCRTMLVPLALRADATRWIVLWDWAEKITAGELHDDLNLANDLSNSDFMSPSDSKDCQLPDLLKVSHMSHECSSGSRVVKG